MSIWIDKFAADLTASRPTDFSARKFVAQGSTARNNNPTRSTSNSDHLVALGSSLKSLSYAVEQVAAQGRAELGLAIAALRSVSGSSDPLARGPLVAVDESQVNEYQQRLVNAAAAGFDSIVDPSLRNILQARTGAYVMNSRHAFVPVSSEDATARAYNTAVPEVESVLVDLDRSRGAVDGFHALIRFNLPYSSLRDLVGVRVFRADNPNPVFTRPLSTLSSVGIERMAVLRSGKNSDPSQTQMMLESNGVPNAVTKLNSFDPYTGLRASANGDDSLLVPPSFAGQNPNPKFPSGSVPPELAHLGDAVLSDLNVLANIRRNPLFGFDPGVVERNVPVGQNVNTGLRLGNEAQAQSVANRQSTSLVVESNNRLDFYEVAFIPIDSANVRRVGDQAEFKYDDESVAYGRGYKYFLVTLDSEMRQSPRSQIVDAVIEAPRVPAHPASVAVHVEQTRISIGVTVDDQLIEKFEVYRSEGAAPSDLTSTAPTVADQDGYSLRFYQRRIGDNNYLLIGECMNGLRAGGQFIDPRVMIGRLYTYRVYSVDIFGNKSESPLQFDVYVPDPEQQHVELRAPSILVEVDANTAKVRVTFQCDDERVEQLRLERRDLSIGQDTFTVPQEPPRIIMGPGRLAVGRKALEGEHLYDQNLDRSWSGMFEPTHHLSQVFVDTTVALDHTYQYRIYGQDRYGNRSSYSMSIPLLVVRRPLVNAPTSLSASLVRTSSSIDAVRVSWQEGNVFLSAEDLIGDQTDLSASAIRTLYQVQRLRVGQERWESFPLMTGTVLVDPVSIDRAPNFRPPFAQLNQTYLYRVQAIQTGAFVSNFTPSVSASTAFEMTQPINFSVLVPQVYRRPFFAMLNWDTFEQSGVVDRWEIERAEVNNVAAARLSLKNPDDYSNLDFRPFRTVYRESSRFSGKVQDAQVLATGSATVVGQHQFMDAQVDFGNTYFYRIRAISPQGIRSRWSFRGIRITGSAFERKWMTILTDEERVRLSHTYAPMRLVNGAQPQPRSSISLQPEFSKPDSLRLSPRVSIDLGGGE